MVDLPSGYRMSFVVSCGCVRGLLAALIAERISHAVD